MSAQLIAKWVLSILVVLLPIKAATCAERQSDNVLIRVEVSNRLARPWDIAFLSSQQALVTEKEGGLQQVNLITGHKKLIQGLPDDLKTANKTGLGDNTGLFGIVLDPDFSNQRWIYLSYAATDPASSNTTTKIIRAKLSDGEIRDIQTLLVAYPFSNDRYHYGGGLVFGAQGKLFITIGERLFNEIDEPELPIAQDFMDRRGKIYRINSDGSIPEDNPVFEQPSVPGLFALGIRAAQGLALHPKTNAIWFSEHGTRQGDEINLLEPGANYGWPVKTSGGYRYTDYKPPLLKDRQFTTPKWTWPHTVAPTGLWFYFADEFPLWRGNLLVAGLSQGSFWRFTLSDETIIAAEELFINERIRLRNVKQAPDGKLYVLTDEANGRLLRITQAD